MMSASGVPVELTLRTRHAAGPKQGSRLVNALRLTRSGFPARRTHAVDDVSKAKFTRGTLSTHNSACVRDTLPMWCLARQWALQVARAAAAQQALPYLHALPQLLPVADAARVGWADAAYARGFPCHSHATTDTARRAQQRRSGHMETRRLQRDLPALPAPARRWLATQGAQNLVHPDGADTGAAPPDAEITVKAFYIGAPARV